MEKLKFSALSESALNEREMNAIVGGYTECTCGCHGSSGVADNGIANYDGGKHTTSKDIKMVICRP